MMNRMMIITEVWWKKDGGVEGTIPFITTDHTLDIDLLLGRHEEQLETLRKMIIEMNLENEYDMDVPISPSRAKKEDIKQGG